MKNKITKVGYTIDSEDTLLGLLIECPYCKTELYEKVIKDRPIQTHTFECLCCGKILEIIV